MMPSFARWVTPWMVSTYVCSSFQMSTTIKILRNQNTIRDSIYDKTEARLSTPGTTGTHVKVSSSVSPHETPSIDNEELPSEQQEQHTITLHYENRSCQILAFSDETILAALERNQRELMQGLDLPNAMIPHDCRRGNCLTCCGSMVEATPTSRNAIISEGDGLSPHISKTLSENGYVLTCSSKVVGSGLELQLGENESVWKAIYQERFETEPSQTDKWAAMAQAKRLSDERNQFRWKKETEQVLNNKNGAKPGDGK